MTELYHSGWKYFRCQQCGKCCEQIGLPWDHTKIHDISNHLNIFTEKVIETYYGDICDDGKHWK